MTLALATAAPQHWHDSPEATSPEFALAVPVQPVSSCRFRTYSVIYYGGVSLHGFDLAPLEFNLLCRDDSHALYRARFEASYQKRTHCKVRGPDGAILFDGRSELRVAPVGERGR